MDDDENVFQAVNRATFKLGAAVLMGLLGGLLVVVFLTYSTDTHAGPADDDQSTRVRVSVTTEALHGQGYWSPGIRIGKDGGYGLRFGSMRAPVWARRIPDNITVTDPRTGQRVSIPLELGPEWKIDSISYVEVDREFCGQRWCGGIGAARLNGHTYMNGSTWNFGLHVRYAIDRQWSLVLDHYSHGSMLGIAQDKSNRGWNLIGVAYSF